jgi:hypothetical protein
VLAKKFLGGLSNKSFLVQLTIENKSSADEPTGNEALAMHRKCAKFEYNNISRKKRKNGVQKPTEVLT